MTPHTVTLRIRRLVVGSDAMDSRMSELIAQAIGARLSDEHTGFPGDTLRGVSEAVADAVRERLGRGTQASHPAAADMKREPRRQGHSHD
jgi:hypothetical protein